MTEPMTEPGKRSCGRGSLTHRQDLVWVLCMLSIAVLLAGATVTVYLLNRPTGVAARDVLVEKGMTVARIASRLHAEGVVRSPKLLRLLSVATGTSRKLKAGLHHFHGGMSTLDALRELEIPRDITHSVTIPEGLRRERTCAILASELGLDESRLLSITSDSLVARQLGVDAPTLEGYLFPETYMFSLMGTEMDAVKTMVDQFHRVLDGALRERAEKRGFTIHQAVTMASIVEGEAQVDHERPVVAAVYHNRLRKRMRLQADPTVQYALGGEPRRLFYKDYEFDSPYNTYRRRGLPPGPILSPGRESIRAALYPAKVDFLYFVARGDGSHIFSRTAAEHERAKRKTRWSRINSFRRSKAR